MSTNISEYFSNIVNGGNAYNVETLISFSINFVVVLIGAIGCFAILLSYVNGKDKSIHRMLIISMISADFLMLLTDLVTISIHFAHGWRSPGINPVVAWYDFIYLTLV